MKYIRTKDGIYNFEEENNGLPKMPERYGTSGNCSGFPYVKINKNEDVIKQSDNIEDLCDDFVLYDEEAQQYVTLEKGFYHRFNIECKKALHLVNKYIYGAIWIVGDNKEPILKSVAKMNNEGELVLL